MSHNENAPSALVSRLKSLRVVLGIDSPETRGWAPAVQREARRVIDDIIAALAHPIPQGWRLLKDSTYDERSWPEDASHENGNYSCCCCHCGRMFMGHKRRVSCKVCAA